MSDPAQFKTRERAGVGRVDYMEFKENIWVNNIMSYRKGGGNEMIRWLIKHAREINKTLYGEINPMSAGLSKEQLRKWYTYYGCKPIYMKGHPNAIKLR